MTKLTLGDLKKLRKEQKKQFSERDMESKDIEVIVGMGTCGIASGSKETLNSFISELKKYGLENVVVRQTGCMGLCNVEPTIEIKMSDMPNTIYGNVSADKVKNIIENHLINHKMVDGLIQDKPAADIIN